MNKYPKETRTCIACRKKKNKYSMYRFFLNEKTIEYDEKYTKGGKGIYLCKDKTCVNLLILKKSLDKLFKKKIDSQMYETIKEIIDNQSNS